MRLSKQLLSGSGSQLAAAPWRLAAGARLHHPLARPARASAPGEGSSGSSGPEECLVGEDCEEFTTPSGTIAVVDGDEAETDLFGESTLGNLHFAESGPAALPGDVLSQLLGLAAPGDVAGASYAGLAEATQAVLAGLEVPPTTYPDSRPQRAVFCSRTLNLRSIQVIGYDMDYTLIHYDVNAWEGKAYAYGLQSLRELGCPVEGLRFDPDLVIRGLILDTELGNTLKVDRFGYVKRAMHGTRMLSASEVRAAYGREVVNLRNEARWAFLNTLFSVSEAVLYMQMVDRLDQQPWSIPTQVCAHSYSAISKLVAKALFRAHVEGKLKAEIIQNPAAYVELDGQLVQALMDQKAAGKALLLITNSDLEYTQAIMAFAFDAFLPPSLPGWRALFDVVIVNARKPDFFSQPSGSLYEVVTEDGLMRPTRSLKAGGIYCGGSAAQVERALGVAGDSILYVGDHIYSDSAAAKLNLRWRTALVVRELEAEVEAMAAGRAHRTALKDLLNKKERVGDLFNNLRLARQRALGGSTVRGGDGGAHGGGGAPPPPQQAEGVRGGSVQREGPVARSRGSEAVINEMLAQLINVMEELDALIGPMVEADGREFNTRWGALSRAGVNDKSALIRMVEKFADIYTSRVANFLRYTPYAYFRSPGQALAHDRPTADALVGPTAGQAGPPGAGVTSGGSGGGSSGGGDSNGSRWTASLEAAEQRGSPAGKA